MSPPLAAVTAATVQGLMPEILLVLAAITIYLVGAFTSFRSGWLLAFVGVAIPLWLAVPESADSLTAFGRWTTLAVGMALVLVQGGDVRPAAHRRLGTCEEAGTFLILLAGLSLVAVADNLVLLFVGLEMVSIPTYVLLGLTRTSARGQEAALKYFFLSLVASAIFLYGVVCLYGIGGDVSLAAIGEKLRSGDVTTERMTLALLPLAVGMLMVGTAFRMAAVPMQFYAPDVYEGTSTPLAGVLSTLPKLAGVVVLVRCIGLAAGASEPGALAYTELFWQVAAVLAALTMTVGNLMALVQNNLRRLLACSSIAHAGYLLVGITAAAAGANSLTQASTSRLDGADATLYYLSTYLLATSGVFAAITYLGHRWPIWTPTTPRPPREEVSTVSDLDGLASTNPVVAFALAVFLLSLAGVPPLPGFWGKLSLVTSLLEVDWGMPITMAGRRAWFLALAITLVINAAIAAAYYLRLIAAMYFRPADRGVQADGGLSAGLAMLGCLVIAVLATFSPRMLAIQDDATSNPPDAPSAVASLDPSQP